MNRPRLNPGGLWFVLRRADGSTGEGPMDLDNIDGLARDHAQPGATVTVYDGDTGEFWAFIDRGKFGELRIALSPPEWAVIAYPSGVADITAAVLDHSGPLYDG